MMGITKDFDGLRANDGINFDLETGEIHGLLGENGAGKTTLMRILAGLLRPDEGTIEVRGRAVTVNHPKAAQRLGIAMVHQHFMLVPNMSVAENIALVARRTASPLAPTKGAEGLAAALAEEFGFTISPRALVETLSVGQQQQVEILKALCTGARILVLDEPTASLTPPEWDHLADLLRKVAGSGSSVVFITHKLPELLRVADRCTVLREGRLVGNVAVRDTNQVALARMMVGRDVVLRVARPALRPGGMVLEVDELTLLAPDGSPRLRDVAFGVREKEILGIAGVQGNGQSDLIDVLTGVRSPTRGHIVINGRPADRLSARQFTADGGGVIPEDRHRQALTLDLSVSDNLIMKEASTPRFSRYGFLMRRAVQDYTDEVVAGFDIRLPRSTVLMRQLSGGNQQKVVLARELSRQPKLLIAGLPTRGLDVGATEFVYRQILAHRARGGATVLVSNELDEILSLSDRVAVMVGGRISRILDAGEVTLDMLGLLMGGEAV
jgi:ABC-type uncharacterized transport system ATPase subunit